MKGVFWNIRDLRDSFKTRFLIDTSKEHMLDFISLLETKKKEKDFTQAELNGLCGGRNFIWD